MKRSNEQKTNIIQRLLTSTLKCRKCNENVRSKSPVYKFKYELPNSFLRAVDTARMKSGYDILRHHHHRSVSSSSSDQTQQHLQTVSEIFRPSLSTNDLDKITTKKIPFRRTPRGRIQEQQQQQQHQQIHHTTAPLLVSPRPAFRMMMNPNCMMINRCRRPLNIMPVRTPLHMPQRQIFRLRFR